MHATLRRLAPIALALALAACGGSTDESATDTSTTSSTPVLSGEVRVFAAASLTESFTAMGKTFEAAHPGVKVTFNFAASSALAQQLNEGGPADVFASADAANMDEVVAAGKAADPTTFARNRLSILVEKGNPKGITSLADLAEPGVVFVVCASAVPCGKIAEAMLAKAGVTATPASLEENVKAVVAKVTLGEADAGLVYATDVKAAGDTAQGVAVDIADDPALEAVYPIAVVTGSANEPAARAWVEFVTSDEGQAALAGFGFLAT